MPAKTCVQRRESSSHALKFIGNNRQVRPVRVRLRAKEAGSRLFSSKTGTDPLYSKSLEIVASRDDFSWLFFHLLPHEPVAQPSRLRVAAASRCQRGQPAGRRLNSQA